MSRGKRAITSWVELRNLVSSTLEDLGYSKHSVKAFEQLRCQEDKLYCHLYLVGKSIYQKQRRVHFIVLNREKWPNGLVIHCRWQTSSGSVDSKFPYDVLSIKEDGYPAIIVLDGKGYSEGARAWLKAHEGKGCIKRVLNVAEFQQFAHDNL